MRQYFSWLIVMTFLLVMISSCVFTDRQQQNGLPLDEGNSAQDQGGVIPAFPQDSPTPPPEIDIFTDEGGTFMTIEEIEKLVKADLASRLGISTEEIHTQDISPRTWADKGLECSTRKGFYEPDPVPGYQILLSYEDREYRYHTDQEGIFAFCPDPGKPIDPIR
jgi:hypothetical protein